MGLPIWRDPDEEKGAAKSEPYNDPTAQSRSPIRRRPSVHGRRDGRPRIPREQSFHSNASPQNPSTWSRLRRMREAVMAQSRNIPPVSSLLESAAHDAPQPPPPVPEPRNFMGDGSLPSEDDITRRALRIARRGGQGAPDFPPIPRDFRSWPPSARRAWVDENLTGPYRRRRGETAQNATQASEPQRFLDVTGNRAPLFRSPEPLIDVDPATGWGQRPASIPPPSSLPTPPRDRSLESGHSSDTGSLPAGTTRRSHPLSNSWRPESPINGLGDRNRSPTPGDGWEMMRTTIMPDANLPSADSSFTSAAASNSFSSSNDDTTITAPTESDVERNPRHGRSNSSSISSVDADDLVCADEDMINATEEFAEDMYFHEQTYPEGRERIRELEQRRAAEGNRFALEHEPTLIDIGFRLIEAALDTEDGRRRLIRVRSNISSDEVRDVTRERETAVGRRRTRTLHLLDDDAPTPDIRALTPVDSHDRGARPSSMLLSESENEVRAHREGVRSRHGAATEFTRSVRAVDDREMSPPSISVDGPLPHPVSPPAHRSEAAFSDPLLGDLSGNGQDLESMRRIVERLAQRDDVPDDWWMSMGLNLSRTRPRALDDAALLRLTAAPSSRTGDRERGSHHRR